MFRRHFAENTWIGSGSIILAGVTIGKNTVVGAGSVVTRDIPDGVLAIGTPCRVIREIGDHEKEYYFRREKLTGRTYPNMLTENN